MYIYIYIYIYMYIYMSTWTPILPVHPLTVLLVSCRSMLFKSRKPITVTYQQNKTLHTDKHTARTTPHDTTSTTPQTNINRRL